MIKNKENKIRKRQKIQFVMALVLCIFNLIANPKQTNYDIIEFSVTVILLIATIIQLKSSIEPELLLMMKKEYKKLKKQNLQPKKIEEILIIEFNEELHETFLEAYSLKETDNVQDEEIEEICA